MKDDNSKLKEPYTAPLLTQHEPLRALTGSSGKGKDAKDGDIT